ncbi:MAG TPA: hypothetical protein VM618_04000, partial [Acidimicrobiia bacterium]|nr:hypothetical protein [Acidimicrobiia bacterium]
MSAGRVSSLAWVLLLGAAGWLVAGVVGALVAAAAAVVGWRRAAAVLAAAVVAVALAAVLTLVEADLSFGDAAVRG